MFSRGSMSLAVRPVVGNRFSIAPESDVAGKSKTEKEKRPKTRAAFFRRVGGADGRNESKAEGEQSSGPECQPQDGRETSGLT